MQLLLAIVFVIGGMSAAAAQEVILTGNTYRLSGPRYEGLPGVEIVVTRGNSVIRQGKSGPNGRFTLSIPEGAPFTVAFYGEQRVPELQQLAGLTTPKGSGTENNVNMTLLTPSEYRQRRGSLLPLAQKRECDLAMLPQEAKAAREYIQAMLPVARALQ